VRRESLTSSLTRITVGGEQLAGFSALGPEDHVKLFFPSPSGERVSRDYTPAVFAEDALELSIDFVVHGDTGPATRFARGAREGDRLVVAGPRGSRLAPRGASKYVLVADEAALPALGRWIDAVRDVAEVFAFVQSDSADVLDYPLPGGDRVAVTAIGTGADAALSALEGPALDDGTYVWAAGEAGGLIPLRRALRRDRGFGKDRAKVDGYWRRGVAGLDHHAPLDPEDPDD
jgi:NADPH-dependent ferric siderophore reductase